MNLKSLVVSMLLFTLIMFGGVVVISDFASETVDLPGDEQRIQIQDQINSAVDDINAVTEDLNLLSGMRGIIGLIKAVVIDMPIYAGVIITETASHFGLPGTVAVTIPFIIIMIAVYEGILLLRGVSQ